MSIDCFPCRCFQNVVDKWKFVYLYMYCMSIYYAFYWYVVNAASCNRNGFIRPNYTIFMLYIQSLLCPVLNYQQQQSHRHILDNWWPPIRVWRTTLIRNLSTQSKNLIDCVCYVKLGSFIEIGVLLIASITIAWLHSYIERALSNVFMT